MLEPIFYSLLLFVRNQKANDDAYNKRAVYSSVYFTNTI